MNQVNVYFIHTYNSFIFEFETKIDFVQNHIRHKRRHQSSISMSSHPAKCFTNVIKSVDKMRREASIPDLLRKFEINQPCWPIFL